MSAIKSLKPVRSGKYADVSVISLDAMKAAQKLTPGEPYRLSAGVTISVLQSAAEGLLEIEAEAGLSTTIDGQQASELATVQTGQIIKTLEGRFVMVRHLEAFVLPKSSPGRSSEVQQIIDLALASLPAEPVKVANSKRPVQVASPGLRKRTLRLGIAAAAVLLGLCYVFLQPEETETLKLEASPGESIAKSRIVAASANNGDSAPAPVRGTASTLSVSEPAAVVPAVAPPKAAPAPAVSARARPAQTTAPSPQAVVKLTERDRQTIMEYKLEARFDRSNARAKLKHFADTFPAGSPARLEVERAYNSL